MAVEQPKRKRRGKVRVKTLAGGGVVVCLLFWLGNEQGWFESGGGDPMGVRHDSSGGDVTGGQRGPTPDPQRRIEPKVDAELAGEAAGRGNPERGDSATGAVDPAGSKSAVVGDPPKTTSAAAQVDATLGLIAEFERAVADQRLADLATMVERLKTTPLQVPAELEQRFSAVRARVDAALLCAPRLRDLLRQGQVLQARGILTPIRQASTPAWLRSEVDAAAHSFGWPALCRADTVVPGSVAAAEVGGLPRHRRIRYARGGELQDGRVWGSAPGKVTLRLSGAAGLRYPRIDRTMVEPVDPTKAEALHEGLAAAHGGDALGVALWSCYLHEAGDASGSTRLRGLLRPPAPGK